MQYPCARARDTQRLSRTTWSSLNKETPGWDVAFVGDSQKGSPKGCLPVLFQGSALYGPIPVKTETFRELSGPLVHTNSGGNSYGPIIGLYLFLGKFVWTNGPESSSKVPPYTGIGLWMAFSQFFLDNETGQKEKKEEDRKKRKITERN